MPDSGSWASRSSGANVFLANALSTQAEIDSVAFDGTWTEDNTTKPSGQPGSAVITIPGNAGSHVGSLKIPFTSKGDGDSLYLQFRAYLPPEYIYQVPPTSDNSMQGFKLCHISNTSQTNRPWEVIFQPGSLGYIQGYYSNSFVYWDTSVSTACNGSDFKHQPSIDRGTSVLTGVDPDDGTAWSSCEQARARYGGLYSGTPGNNSLAAPGIGDPLTGAVRVPYNQWATYEVGITIGNFDSANSRIRWWVAPQDGPFTLLADLQNITIPGAGPYNCVWLDPYYTNRDGTGAHRSVASRTGAISGVNIRCVGLATPTGNGTLSYTASTKQFTFQANGESAGTARGVTAQKTFVNVFSSGHASQANNSGHYLGLEVDYASLPGSDTSETVNISSTGQSQLVRYAEVIASTSVIPGPGGYIPS